jgi:chromosome segregation ATPase
MTKAELIELLKNYKENKAKLNIKLKELKVARIKLKACDDIETSITSAYGENQDIHSKNKISNKVLKKVEENETKRNELIEEIEKLEEEVKQLRDKVEAVEDRLDALKYKEKELLYAYHIEGRTYEDIGNNLYLRLFAQTRDKDTIKTIVEKATNKMLNL